MAIEEREKLMNDFVQQNVHTRVHTHDMTYIHECQMCLMCESESWATRLKRWCGTRYYV